MNPKDLLRARFFNSKCFLSLSYKREAFDKKNITFCIVPCEYGFKKTTYHPLRLGEYKAIFKGILK